MYQNNMFFNRELSWLQFNKRVLELAEDKRFPILERLKFCGIFSSNLDEFFMVRAASIMDQIHARYETKDPSGLSPTEQLERISPIVRELIDKQYDIFDRLASNELMEQGIRLLQKEELSKEQMEFVKRKFELEIFPVLTPMAVDMSHPFPLILNRSLNIAVQLESDGKKKYATVQVPAVLDRLVRLPSEGGRDYITLELIIDMNIQDLFVGKKILKTVIYRPTRNADLNIHEDDAEDLLMVIEKSLKKRKWGEIIRVEVSGDTDDKLLRFIVESMGITRDRIYKIPGLIDLRMVFQLLGDKGLDHLKSEPGLGKKIIRGDGDLFEEIKKGDIFVNHPYESFDIVTKFIQDASMDKDVLAIKQTLYRVSGDSPIVRALAQAAERGKQVTVLVELMARFDEENNINWAKKLEQTGCHVIYGLYGYKTHSKITLIVRRENNIIRRYVHLGTGNYNDQTAKIYTDMGIFTAKDSYGSDSSAFFNMVSGYSSTSDMNRLVIAPHNLRNKVIELIDREINNCKKGGSGRIIAKMNSLVDSEIISKLYDASKAGVKIYLNIRGICCLRPGVKGLSENIEVVSIVGKDLEHSRAFYFYNNSIEEVFLSSADWMPRNLDRRVEIMFPVEVDIIKERIKSILELYLLDNYHGYRMLQDGTYIKNDISKEDVLIDSQGILSSLEYDDDHDFVEKIRSVITYGRKESEGL